MNIRTLQEVVNILTEAGFGAALRRSILRTSGIGKGMNNAKKRLRLGLVHFEAGFGAPMRLGLVHFEAGNGASGRK
ncbi:hypothetical protein HON22_00260 [Candidatus Peregrinibacteria bacterium]|jgi:hypothetical protein|nr:hypothetical protein [Candidatus Peregrinibacteria bacterium]